MGAPEKYTVKQIEIELKRTYGAITLAAENLDCAYNTIRRYVDKSPRLQKLIEHYRERRVDKAELKLEQAIANGEPWAIALTLKTLGKKRGFVERQEVTGKDGDDLFKGITYIKENRDGDA
jgi:hypothetical protein